MKRIFVVISNLGIIVSGLGIGMVVGYGIYIFTIPFIASLLFCFYAKHKLLKQIKEVR